MTLPTADLIDNDRHAETGEAYSLAAAEDRLEGELIVSYGDILFRDYILRGLLSTDGDIVLAVDTGDRDSDGRPRDWVQADAVPGDDYVEDELPCLIRLDPALDRAEACGEWIGLARFSAEGSRWLREEVTLLRAEGLIESADLPLLITRIAAKHPVKLHLFAGHWMDVDTLADLAAARNFT